jgi:hypothetical protein
MVTKQEVLKLLKQGRVQWNNGIQLFVKVEYGKVFLRKDEGYVWVEAGQHLTEELLKQYG